jgi:hypothetical protein
MAENKKSFIAYSDWYGMFKALPDDLAGKLIKHIFAYVNDENPTTDDFMVNALFEQIKATLKRDLIKWEDQREQRSYAGKKSAEARSTKSNERSISLNENVRNPTVSVNVNDNVISLNRADDFALQCLEDNIWKEAICMQKVLTPITIEFALKDYNIHLIQQGENKNNIKEYKSHFVNWVKKKKELKAKDVQYQNKDRL